uniref:Uncharacterized protein n=1 Tax=Panagrolaimus sp. ES5 TaxID=591445 RepID=A0AC34FP67_9BILA
MLEGEPMKEKKKIQLAQIREDSDDYMEAVFDLVQKNKDLMKEMDEKELAKKIIEQTQDKFGKYVDSIFDAHRSFRHGFEDDSPTWDFLNAIVFTSTTVRLL